MLVRRVVCCVAVDCLFCCSWLRWPLIVASEVGRCLEISSGVRPGQVEKCPSLMCLMKVSLVGLKHAACRYSASCRCVPLVLMTPLARGNCLSGIV